MQPIRLCALCPSSQWLTLLSCLGQWLVAITNSQVCIDCIFHYNHPYSSGLDLDHPMTIAVLDSEPWVTFIDLARPICCAPGVHSWPLPQHLNFLNLLQALLAVLHECYVLVSKDLGSLLCSQRLPILLQSQRIWPGKIVGQGFKRWRETLSASTDS